MIRLPHPAGDAVPRHLVNLDALIKREVFDADPDAKPATDSLEGATKLKLVELESDSLMFRWLRKPDFQRTTAYWPPAKVANFVRDFVDANLIPSLILWRAPASGRFFVIDGAHRLSALVAYVHDDYGDKGLSIPFFERIPEEQRKAAEETRELIRQKVGSYIELKHGMGLEQNQAGFASFIAADGVPLQWVRGDATRAYRSFHTINTAQTPLGVLERRLIRDRRGPNAIATRALISAGTGQYSRTSFSDENKVTIRTLAREVYDDMFDPPLKTPIKTLDLPVAGRGYSSDSVALILDFVESVNRSILGKDGVRRKKRDADDLEATVADDVDGSMTIECLRNVRKASSLIAGNQARSLGLHPAVYFYSATGNYQPSAFLAAVRFAQGLDAQDRLMEFTKHRSAFEELLLKYKHFINEIVKRRGAGDRSVGAVTKFYSHLFEGVAAGRSEAAIVPTIAADPVLEFLGPLIDSGKGTRKSFTSERKSAVFLREALASAVTCFICGARVHAKSMTIHHSRPKAAGGVGSVDNGELTHPYCNSINESAAFKEMTA